MKTAICLLIIASLAVAGGTHAEKPGLEYNASAAPAQAADQSATVTEESPQGPEPATDNDPMPLTIEVRNRLYPDFLEVHEMHLNELAFIGDTDYSFKVVEFYPHFAIVEVDSTRTIKSLSDEPKNVAFKIEVYENGELMKTAWAFYTVRVPHFARDDYITFDVTKFVYRGETFSKEQPEEAY